jgi:capsular exopolysaccharide synthesis family protein
MTLPIVKRYLIAFDNYKLAGFATFILALGVSGIFAMFLEPPEAPPFRARGKLTYKNPPVLFSETSQSIRERGQQLTPGMLVQHRVVESVLNQVNIPVNEFKDSVNVSFEEESPIINVSYVDSSRERATEVVSLLMDEMIEQSRLINSDHLRSIIETSKERLGPAEAELREAEQKLEAYDKREGATLLAVESGALPTAIIQNEQTQEQLLIQLETTKAQINSLEAQLGMSTQQAYVAQALTADPIIAQLRAQLHQIEAQLELLRKDYRDQHPQVAALIKQQQTAEQQLQERASEVLGGDGIAAPLRAAEAIRVDSSLDPARLQLAQNLMLLKTQRESLEQQLANTREIGQNLRQEYASIPNKQLEKQRLEQQVLYKKTLYDKIQAQLIDAQAAESETVSSLQVAQGAYAPDVEIPEALSMALILAGGGLAGVLGGAALIFVLGLLSGKFYTWEEIRGAFQEREVPVLGVLPNLMMLEETPQQLPLLLKPHSPYLNYYEKVRSNLRRVGAQLPKVILLTSAGSQEGKTLSAYNLAIATARTGKRTLLIEADLRSPSQVEALRLAPDPYAAAEPLQYYSDLNECIRMVPDVENLYVIPSPGSIRQGSTVLESSEIQRLLKEVRHRFDLVIIDAPSLSSNNDALTLEPFTDGMVMVARPTVTLSGLMGELTDQLTEVDEEEDTNKYRPRLLGAIINGADITVEADEPVEEIQPFSELPLQPTLTSDSRPLPQLPSEIRR